MSEQQTTGWQCPICKMVYAPNVKKCKKCQKDEQTVDSGKQLLTE